MFKKTLAIVLAIALVTAMWLIPSSADSSFEETAVIDVNYFAKSTADAKGVLTFGRAVTPEFVDDMTAYGAYVPAATMSSLAAAGNLKYTGSYDVDVTHAYEFYGVFTPGGTLHDYCYFNFSVTEAGNVVATMTRIPNGSANITLTSEKTYDITKALHVMLVSETNAYKLYVNGELAASQEAQMPDLSDIHWKDVRIAGLYSNATHLIRYRVFNSAPTADQVQAVYNSYLPAVATEVPTAEPTAEPTTEPTVEPTVEPTAEPPVPTGDDYTIVADEVHSFKAGDEVKVKLTITDIREGISIVGFDWELSYNPYLLEVVEDGFASSCDVLNDADSEVAWELLTNIDDTNPELPILKITLLDDGKEYKGISENNALWVEITFKALADGNVEDLLGFIQLAEGTRSDMEVAAGTGVAVFITEAPVVDDSTPAPSNPTEAPSDPTEEPLTPDVPVTFDIGLISLAAVALSSITAIKKRK